MARQTAKPENTLIRLRSLSESSSRYPTVWFISISSVRWFTAITTLILLATLPGCSSSKKLSTPATTVRVPDTLPTLPASEIDIPLKIVAKPILALADSLIPIEFTSDNWPNYLQTDCEFRYRYRFVRSAFTIGCVDNHFTLAMKGAYQVAGSKRLCALEKPVSPWISGNCGFGAEPMRKVDFLLSSRLSLSPDYRIHTRSRLDQLQPLDKCVMSMFSMDMTGMILDSIRSSIDGSCTILDETIAGLDFTPLIRTTLTKPTALYPYGWLNIDPSNIRISPLNLIKDTFRLNVGISCRPALVSDSNITRHASTLPRLTNASPRTGVTVYLPVTYDYDFITRTMKDSLRDHSFIVKGRIVTIKDIAMRPLGKHQIEIRIDFTGSRTGRLYLRGTPVLDTARQGLSLPDISYSLESKDLALRLARSLFRNKIRKTLRGNSYLDLAALLKTNLPILEAQLNRSIAPNISSTGHIHDLRLIGLLATEKNIQAQIFIRADLSVTSTSLPNF